MDKKKIVLKPCPFCGIKPNLHRIRFRYTLLHECNAVRSVVGWGKLDEVSETWNTRAGR